MARLRREATGPSTRRTAWTVWTVWFRDHGQQQPRTGAAVSASERLDPHLANAGGPAGDCSLRAICFVCRFKQLRVLDIKRYRHRRRHRRHRQLEAFSASPCRAAPERAFFIPDTLLLLVVIVVSYPDERRANDRARSCQRRSELQPLLTPNRTPNMIFSRLHPQQPVLLAARAHM